MRDYFINLGENIRNSFNAEGKIKVACDMPELVLDVDTAISVGLIANQLLTNAFKYALEGKQLMTKSGKLLTLRAKVRVWHDAN